MKDHKFITVGTDEYFTGDVFVEASRQECFVCGALFESVRLNYSGDFVFPSDMSFCSGNTWAHFTEGVKQPDCSCLWCDA